jgi:hypothetical protein
MSRSLAIYTYRRQQAAPEGSYHRHYKSPILSRASPSVGPSTSLTLAQKASRNSYSKFREPLAPSQLIRGMAETWMTTTMSLTLSEEELLHSSRSAVSSQFG